MTDSRQLALAALKDIIDLVWDAISALEADIAAKVEPYKWLVDGYTLVHKTVESAQNYCDMVNRHPDIPGYKRVYPIAVYTTPQQAAAQEPYCYAYMHHGEEVFTPYSGNVPPHTTATLLYVRPIAQPVQPVHVPEADCGNIAQQGENHGL